MDSIAWRLNQQHLTARNDADDSARRSKHCHLTAKNVDVCIRFVASIVEVAHVPLFLFLEVLTIVARIHVGMESEDEGKCSTYRSYSLSITSREGESIDIQSRFFSHSV